MLEASLQTLVRFLAVSGLEAGHERDYKSSCHPFRESTYVIAHPTHSGASLFDTVRKLELICTQMERPVYFLVNADGEELQLLNHSLNVVPHIEYRCGEFL